MLNDDQLAGFRDTGLLSLPGAIEASQAAAMVDRIWEHLSDSNQIVRDRAATWPLSPPTGLRALTAEPGFAALGSPTVRAVLDDLLGAGRWQPPRRWGRLLVTFPSRTKQWDLPTGGAWHNDFVPLRSGVGERALQLFMILQDLPARGGGTLVLTGSHRLVTRYIDDTGKAPHPSSLRRALGGNSWLRELWEPPEHAGGEQRVRRYMMDGLRIDDVDLRVVEVTGRAGDVYVMHCDTFHAAAPNIHDRPRIMATNIVLVDAETTHGHANASRAQPDLEA
uniref:phytanoyl-CoA dioxygenase family protein n=1 Tax=Paractinoplanes polyasparticus TaxID=2856853 RepID=UPI001C84E6EB|nr:phytanoyl-CoA dioxygenase family protein [Actinoplanes polyasparticus]